MVAELLEGEGFQHFLERAEAAREGHEGVAPLVHERLAVSEPVGDHELREARVAHAELQERLGDDPGDRAAVSEDCPRETAHEAHASASVDEPPAAPGELRPEFLGRGEVLRVHAVARAAEHGDRADDLSHPSAHLHTGITP